MIISLKTELFQPAVKTIVFISSALMGLNLQTLTANAAIIATYEEPGVQASKGVNIKVETFDQSSVGVSSSYTSTALGGTYTPSKVKDVDSYGGAGGVGNYFQILYPLDPLKSTLELDLPQAYFGMWWSAGDQYNELKFYLNETLIYNFTTANLSAALSSAYYGNPNPPLGVNTSEPYAFINFFGTNGTRFDKIVFSNPNPATGFESDNHTISTTEQDQTGTVVDVPEPNTVLGLAGLALVGIINRYRRFSR